MAYINPDNRILRCKGCNAYWIWPVRIETSHFICEECESEEFVDETQIYREMGHQRMLDQGIIFRVFSFNGDIMHE